MAKRRKKDIDNNLKILTYVAWFLAAVAVTLSILIAGYYLGYQSAKDDIAKQTKLEKQKKQNIPQMIEESIKKSETNTSDSVNNRLKEVLKKDANTTLPSIPLLEKQEKQEVPVVNKVKEEVLKTKTKEEVLSEKAKEYSSAAHEYKDEALDKPPQALQRENKLVASKRPKLAIIIDDISIQSHINAVNSLGLTLTMSFLPPSKGRPNSANLAAHESQYMVHLPMEAQDFSAEEDFTLRINDSQQDISNRIKELKVLFPKVKYINNHTGSKFTSNEIAMNKLIIALKENSIYFVDSRTTGQTAAPKVLKNFGLNYIGRDVFLDHKMEKAYVVGQIKEAIRIAKKYGTAIAIGHPHVNTIMALHESKNLFKDVDLVYIDKLN
ncbi:MAG: divergent polysaccharide deacetylase family protein [Sulfurimonas sp.]|jgi:hypothetical protein